MIKQHHILLLHGYGMSAASILSKTGALRSEVKKLQFEFTAIDAPFDCITDAPMPARPPTPPKQRVASSETKNDDDDANDDNSQNSPVSAAQLPSANLTLEPGARAWYSFQNVDETSKYEKFEQGFQSIVDHCAERDKQGLPPYRGIFAFSQGTIMATVLAARLQNYRKSKSSRFEFPPFMCHFDFFVLVSGLLPKDVGLRQEIVSSAPLNTFSSLHIVGKTDRLVDPLKTIELAGLFGEKEESEGERKTHKVLWEHEGGHVIPSQARKPFKAFLEQVVAGDETKK